MALNGGIFPHSSPRQFGQVGSDIDLPEHPRKPFQRLANRMATDIDDQGPERMKIITVAVKRRRERVVHTGIPSPST